MEIPTLSVQLVPVYAEIARKNGYGFRDAGIYARPGDADGLHFTAESHLRLDAAVTDKMQEALTL